MKEVREIRIELCIKQIDFAKILKIGQANYSNIEAGRLIPKNINKIRVKALKALIPFIKKREEELNAELSELNHYRNFIQKETTQN